MSKKAMRLAHCAAKRRRGLPANDYATLMSVAYHYFDGMGYAEASDASLIKHLYRRDPAGPPPFRNSRTLRASIDRLTDLGMVVPYRCQGSVSIYDLPFISAASPTADSDQT